MVQPETEPFKWILYNLKVWWYDSQLHVYTRTSAALRLSMLYTTNPPKVTPIYRTNRGVRQFCYNRKDLIGYKQAVQEEDGDTEGHTFMALNLDPKQTVYYRFRGVKLSKKSVSSSQIFQTTPDLPWEAWDYLYHANQPWQIVPVEPYYFGYSEDGLELWNKGWGIGPALNTIALPAHTLPGKVEYPVCHYLKTYVAHGDPEKPIEYRIRLAYGPVYGSYWYMSFWSEGYPFPDDPHWDFRERHTNVGWGRLAIDLWQAIADMRAHYHASLLTPANWLALFDQEILTGNCGWTPALWWRQPWIQMTDDP